MDLDISTGKKSGSRIRRSTGLRRGLPATCLHILSCISIKRTNPGTDREPHRARYAVGYLSAPVLLSSPPAPRSHLGPHRTSRRSDSPGSSSSLHGGSRPVCRQPSSQRCSLCGFPGISDSTEASNAAASTADLSCLCTAKVWRLNAGGVYLLWNRRVCALAALEGAEPASWWSQPIRGRDSWADRSHSGREASRMRAAARPHAHHRPGGVSSLSKALYDRMLLEITNTSTFGRTACIADKLEDSFPAPSDRCSVLNSNLIV